MLILKDNSHKKTSSSLIDIPHCYKNHNGVGFFNINISLFCHTSGRLAALTSLSSAYKTDLHPVMDWMIRFNNRSLDKVHFLTLILRISDRYSLKDVRGFTTISVFLLLISRIRGSTLSK